MVPVTVFVLGLTSLAVFVTLPSSTTAAVRAPAPSPTAPSLYGLIVQCLATMQSMEHNWTRLANDTLGRVDAMAQRIVDTERLILDEGENIGSMAARIVTTERLVANLTSDCIHCKPAIASGSARVPMGSKHTGVHPDGVGHRPHVNFKSAQRHTDEGGAAVVSLTNAAGATDRAVALLLLLARGQPAASTVGSNSAEVVGDSWMAPFITFMEHTLVLMDEMNSNVTGAIGALESGIGAMADRIVRTECLIMNMSGQIGTMADRIVATEDMLSNVTDACCHGTHGGGAHVVKRISATATPPFTCPPSPTTQIPSAADLGTLRAIVADIIERFEVAALLRRRASLLYYEDGKCNPLDIVCVMLSAMEKCAQAMEDAMMSMAVGVVKDIEQAAGDIGDMADRIVATEGNIIDMGMLIGRLAGVIVDIESDAELVGTLVCNMTVGPPATSPHRRHSVAATAAAAAMGAARASVVRRQRGGEVTANAPLPTPTASPQSRRLASAATLLEEAASRGRLSATGGAGTSLWDYLKLFAKMARTMAGMAADMASVFTTVADTVDGVGAKIDATMKDIGNMSDQIVVMESRIMATADMMTRLVNNCTQP